MYIDVLRPARAAASSLIADPAVVEDVAQEVLVEIWKTWRSEPGIGSSPERLAWTIGRRRSIDHIRADEARRRRELLVARLETAPPSDPVEREVMINHDATRLRASLDRLDPDKQQSLVLAYYAGHSYRTVAGLLSLAEGTVKRRIRDGLRILAADVGDDGR